MTESRDNDTEETGLNLFDDSASAAGNFPHAMLGYDKHTVDSYIRELEARLNQLKSQVRESMREVAFVKSEVGSTDFTRLGAHVAGLLRAAEAQSGDLIQRAEHEADRIKTEARRSAAAMREAAQQESDDVRLTGLAGMRQLRQEQADLGKSTLETARRDGNLVIADAKARAKSLIESATIQAATLLESARVEGARTEQEAKRKAADIIATAERTAQEALTKSASAVAAADTTVVERLAQAEKEAEAAEARTLESRVEATRIRAEAVTAAEEIRLAATRQAEETLSAMRERGSRAEAELEQKVAWRREQLERDVAALEARKSNSLAQLGNLKALAEEADAAFSDNSRTVRLDLSQP